MINQTIQSFTISRELGSGGMATVYLAENRIGKKVAIKVLAKEHFHNEQIRLRFEQEARVMASLNHENICSVIDLEDNDEFSAIIMEYLEGMDLGEYVNQNDPVPESQVMDWLRQIASGLDYAHSQCYVHRDIKPSNFFLTPKGQVPRGQAPKGQVKIMDFGIAKAEESLVKSQTSSKMGSVAYMSPEQIISPKHVDHKTDIYSLGVTLHHLLGGRVPYDTTTQNEFAVMKQITEEKLAELPGISVRMNSLIQAATAKEAKARPASLAALLDSTGDDTLLERKPASDKTLIDTGTIPPLAAQVPQAQAGTGDKTLIDTGADTHTDPYTGMEFIKVQAGTFMMGCTSEQGSDCYDLEKPAHSVTLTRDYLMGKYEVTQAQWVRVMGSNPSYFQNCDNCPVERVSWNDIQEFLVKLNQQTGTKGTSTKGTGKRYRLPTEAEWEYAARGGNKSKGYKYAGAKGTGSNSIGSVAWYDDNSGDKTHPVGQKAPNELGLYDMSGNVWEWCSDWYGDYSSSSQTDPKGPSSGRNRVLRGGSWYNFPIRCRVSYRSLNTPGGGVNLTGFRLCLSL